MFWGFAQACIPQVFIPFKWNYGLRTRAGRSQTKTQQQASRVAVGKGGAEGAAAGAAAATAEAAMRAAREKAVKACELKGDRDREKT